MSPAPDADGTEPASLSIIICTRDRYDLLRGAIRAIETQTLDADLFELIVVDNSTDLERQASFIGSLNVDCRCDYAIEDRPGLSRARNIGVGLAQGDVVAFLDDDTVADPRWAEAILDRFAAGPMIGVLGGPVEPIWPAARPAWMPPWLDVYLTALDHGPDPHVLRDHEWLVGANLAFRKSALVAAGGFPEALGRVGSALLSNEDVVVVQQIVAAGFEAFYEPAMRVRHHVHPERLTQGWLRRRMAWQAVSDLMSPGRTPSAPGQQAALRGGLDARDVSLLFVDRSDPDEFSRQIAGIRALISLLLDTQEPSAAPPA